MSANKFYPGPFAGYLMRSKNGKDGFVIETRNPPFKAWGKLDKLKLLARLDWTYVTLAESPEYGKPIGTVYISRGCAFFNIKSKQKGVSLIGWTKNLRQFVKGEKNRVSIHLRARHQPKTTPLVLTTREKNGQLLYRISEDGARYGITLTRNQMNLLRQFVKPAMKEWVSSSILQITPNLDGTIEVWQKESQRKLRTTPQELYNLLSQLFVTIKAGKATTQIPLPLGWKVNKEDTNPIVLVGPGKLPPKILLYVVPKDSPLTRHATMPLGKKFEIAAVVETGVGDVRGVMQNRKKRYDYDRPPRPWTESLLIGAGYKGGRRRWARKWLKEAGFV